MWCGECAENVSLLASKGVLEKGVVQILLNKILLQRQTRLKKARQARLLSASREVAEAVEAGGESSRRGWAQAPGCKFESYTTGRKSTYLMQAWNFLN